MESLQIVMAGLIGQNTEQSVTNDEDLTTKHDVGEVISAHLSQVFQLVHASMIFFYVC